MEGYGFATRVGSLLDLHWRKLHMLLTLVVLLTVIFGLYLLCLHAMKRYAVFFDPLETRGGLVEDSMRNRETEGGTAAADLEVT